MKVRLTPNHRFQSILFNGIEISKIEPVEIPAEYEDQAALDSRLVVEIEPKPEKKGRKPHE